MDGRGGEVFPWLLTFKWDTVGPKMEALINYLRSTGASKIGMVGFCWGGWVVCQTAAITPEIKCGVVPHPSIHVEGALGGSPSELVSRVKCPMLVCPAGDDPPMYAPGGEVYEALKANNPDREFIHPFPEMKHGFVTRGDMDDPATKRDKEAALVLMQNFLIEFTN